MTPQCPRPCFQTPSACPNPQPLSSGNLAFSWQPVVFGFESCIKCKILQDKQASHSLKLSHLPPEPPPGGLTYGLVYFPPNVRDLNRIIDAFPTNQQAQVRVQLSVALICILSQVLLARIDKPGRVACYEFLVVTPAIANLIRENKTFRIDSAIQTGRKFGMQLLDDHLWSLYTKGIISADEMIDKSRDPGELTEKVHRAGGMVGRRELDESEE